MRLLYLMLTMGGCTPPAVTIGTGDIVYQPIVDGQELLFVQGQQGGLHVYGSLRAEGVEPGNWDNPMDPTTPLITFELIGPDGHFGGYERTPRPLKVRKDGTIELVGELVILDTTDAEEANDVVVDMRVVVEDYKGRVAEDTREDLVLTQ